MPSFELERKYMADGFSVVCGIDEAGRGPLCGPVFAAACILPPDWCPEELNDSKKLTPKKREKLFDEIREHAVAYAIASASVEEIDTLNILEADLLAMRRAIDALSVKPDFALIDGNIARDFQIPARAVIGGDAKSPSIAAASILAKVTRDRALVALDAEYPELKLAKHKGYPTKEHYAALNAYIDAHGGEIPPIYRRSFLKNLHRE